MTKNNIKKFLKNKDQVVDNLQTLIDHLESSEEMGMLDLYDTLYNEILDLIEEAKGIDTNMELSIIISKAKTIEIKINKWYSHEGLLNIELTWPQI